MLGTVLLRGDEVVLGLHDVVDRVLLDLVEFNPFLGYQRLV